MPSFGRCFLEHWTHLPYVRCLAGVFLALDALPDDFLLAVPEPDLLAGVLRGVGVTPAAVLGTVRVTLFQALRDCLVSLVVAGLAPVPTVCPLAEVLRNPVVFA
jgi:hypothetical protein